jgi:hypothetical protein
MYAADAARIVKRRQIAQRIENFDDLLIDAHGGFELIAAMNDPVPDGVHRTQIGMRAQPRDYFNRRRFVIRRSYLSLLRRLAHNFEFKRRLPADPIHDSARELALDSTAPGLNQLKLESRTAAIKDEHFHDVILQ